MMIGVVGKLGTLRASHLSSYLDGWMDGEVTVKREKICMSKEK